MTTPVEDEDSSSGCSMEGSNTDSGRGPSEDGEQTHNDHGKFHFSLNLNEWKENIDLKFVEEKHYFFRS